MSVSLIKLRPWHCRYPVDVDKASGEFVTTGEGKVSPYCEDWPVELTPFQRVLHV
jgi:hypothetical protein